MRRLGLDLMTLELIAMAAAEGSMSRAAALSHLSLGAASHRISEFERRLGGRVFEREPRGVRITPVGQAALSRIQLVLAGVNSLSAIVPDIRMGVTDHLRLLASSAVVAEFLPERLARFIATHPHVQVEVEELSSTEIVRAIIERRGSIGALWGDVDTRGLFADPLGEDELVLVVPRDHVLARRRAVRFGDTLDYDYVKFEASSQFSLWLSRQASRLNMVVKGRIQVRGFDALCRMAAAGLGIGIVPRRPAEDFSKSMRIAIIELREPWVRRRFNVVYRNRDELASVERTFLSFIEDDWLRHQRPNNLKRGKRSKETKATGKREGYV